MNNHIGLRYNVLGVLKFFSFVLFIIGGIINYDGLRIVLSSKSYSAGLLRVKSLYGGTGAEGGNTVYYAKGNVDTLETSILIGQIGTAYTDSLVQRFSEKEVLLPIWYRPDGKLTLERFSNEDQFPYCRIWKKLTLLFVCFNMPFLSFWFWQFKIKNSKTFKTK